MNNAQHKLLDDLLNYRFTLQDIELLQKRLESAEYRITPTYSVEGAGFGGFANSKVENLGVRKIDTERELHEKATLVRSIDRAIEYAPLTRREQSLVKHLITGSSLSSFARLHNIYKSHVYKIRDRALKKMVEYMQNDTE